MKTRAYGVKHLGQFLDELEDFFGEKGYVATGTLHVEPTFPDKEERVKARVKLAGEHDSFSGEENQRVFITEVK